MPITLYDLVDKDGRRYSPYGWRIRMALAHKGLPAVTELCWHSDRKLSFTGQSLVPVLVDGARVVTDSWKIACYLDEAYPDRPMLMEGVQGHAFAKFINGWTDTIIGPAPRTVALSRHLAIAASGCQSGRVSKAARGAQSRDARSHVFQQDQGLRGAKSVDCAAQ